MHPQDYINKLKKQLIDSSKAENWGECINIIQKIHEQIGVLDINSYKIIKNMSISNNVFMHHQLKQFKKVYNSCPKVTEKLEGILKHIETNNVTEDDIELIEFLFDHLVGVYIDDGIIKDTDENKMKYIKYYREKWFNSDNFHIYFDMLDGSITTFI